LIIRPSVIEDRDELARIRSQRGDGTVEHFIERYDRDLKNHGAAPDNLLLTATVDGVIVGFAKVAWIEPKPDAPANAAPAAFYLAGVNVDLEHRRRGIGRELTRRRMEWIAERASEVFYFANARNLTTIDLHAELGFLEVTRDFYVSGATFDGGVGILFRATVREGR
jgi:GNAT superfamily N-acetyltransferase